MKKINLIRRNNIDISKWNTCIDRSINRRIYACSWYLDMVSNNWEAVVYGDYELVFPIVFKKILFFKKVYHPFFCQQLGPFSSNLSLFKDSQLLSKIVTYLNDNYRKFDFSINHDFVINLQKIKGQFSNINFDERVNLELDLNRDYKELFSNYSKNIKRNLKKNINYNLEIKTSFEANWFVNLYRNKIGYKLNLKSKHYYNMVSLIDKCISMNNAYLYVLYDNLNNLIAGAFFTSYFDRDILLFHFSAQKTNINVMSVLLDKYISLNSSKNKILDFEGSNISSIKRFYKSFGAIEKNYMHIIK